MVKRIKSFVKLIQSIVRLILLWPIVMLSPRDKKKVLFGAWCGNQFSDNPKYFMDYLIGLNKGFKCIWVGNECVRELVEAHPGVKFVLKDSWRAKVHYLTAGWMVSNLGKDCDITFFPTYGKVKLLSFWHGTSVKGVARKGWKEPEIGGVAVLRPIRRFERWLFKRAVPLQNFASISYEKMRYLLPNEVPWAFSSENIVAYGTARIDYLIKNSDNVNEVLRVREKYSKLLDLPLDKKWVLYMPTWRKGLNLTFSFFNCTNKPRFQDVLRRKGMIVIEKQHPQVMHTLQLQSNCEDNIYSISAKANKYIDTQELLLAADMLITDYSSCFCDYEPMNRPVIHFVYDLASYYKNDCREDNQDIFKIAAGPVVQTEEELLACLEMSAEEMLKSKGPDAKKIIEGEQGHACESFAKWVGLL